MIERVQFCIRKVGRFWKRNLSNFLAEPMQFLIRKQIRLLARKYGPFPDRVHAILAEKVDMVILFHTQLRRLLFARMVLCYRMCVFTAAELWVVFGQDMMLVTQRIDGWAA